MEMTVFALGIAGMCDFEGNTKGPFGELIFQPSQAERQCALNGIHKIKYYYGIKGFFQG
jgi:hypothetical protein